MFRVPDCRICQRHVGATFYRLQMWPPTWSPMERDCVRTVANVAGQANLIFSGFQRFLQSFANVSERTNGAQKRHHMRDSHRNIAAHFYRCFRVI